MAQVTVDPRVNYQILTAIQQATKPENLGIPEARFTSLPTPVSQTTQALTPQINQDENYPLLPKPESPSTTDPIINTEISTYTSKQETNPFRNRKIASGFSN